MADFGYDISDYTGIDPLFGSLEDPTRCWRRPKRTASRFCSIWYRTIPPTSTLVPGESLLDITKVLAGSDPKPRFNLHLKVSTRPAHEALRQALAAIQAGVTAASVERLTVRNQRVKSARKPS